MVLKLHSGTLARTAGHVRQSLNFLSHRFYRAKTTEKRFQDIYKEAVEDAFNPERSFIVTGAPHARAYYPRNFAWFYPDLLNPVTILDAEDASHRITLLIKSIELMCRALRKGIHTTTLVPLSRRRIVGIDYFSKPSDSLMGILAAIRQLIQADSNGYREVFESASRTGRIILNEYRSDMGAAARALAKELVEAKVMGSDCLLCDISRPYSAATDARAERARFVTNANIWTTLKWSKELGILEETEISTLLGRSLVRYKEELLAAFAPDGYVLHSLTARTSTHSTQVAIDFAHVRDGFWDFRNENERRIFAKTADIVFQDARFKTNEGSLYLVSIKNPSRSLVHIIAAPSYQGRSAWPAFNVEFADRLLDLSRYRSEYADKARSILVSVRAVIEKYGGYPEVLSKEGVPYRTWAYQSAVAHSWLPRFVSVWHKRFAQLR